MLVSNLVLARGGGAVEYKYDVGWSSERRCVHYLMYTKLGISILA